MPKKTLGQVLKDKGARITKQREPLWQGPEDSGPMGGITQSMLGRAVMCPERFRIRFVEGLAPARKFSPRMDYGTLWHKCEECYAAGVDYKGPLLEEAKKFVKQFPLQQEEVQHWYKVCLTQFPVYIEHWSKHPDDVKGAKTEQLLQEHVFHVPYKLPYSGRTVYLRGKFDSVFARTEKQNYKLVLKENKTKGEVEKEKLQRILGFDLQTMTYLIALIEWAKQDGCPADDVEVLYNVVRRPLSGGRGSIRKHAAKTTKKDGYVPEESDESFYGRLREVFVNEEEEDYWFARWKSEVSQACIDQFKREFFDPFLENLCNEYDWWKLAYERGYSPFDSKTRILNDVFGPTFNHHWRLPFGIYNVLADGGETEYDEYLATKNSVGLRRQETLFDELSE